MQISACCIDLFCQSVYFGKRPFWHVLLGAAALPQPRLPPTHYAPNRHRGRLGILFWPNHVGQFLIEAAARTCPSHGLPRRTYARQPRRCLSGDVRSCSLGCGRPAATCPSELGKNLAARAIAIAEPELSFISQPCASSLSSCRQLGRRGSIAPTETRSNVHRIVGRAPAQNLRGSDQSRKACIKDIWIRVAVAPRVCFWGSKASRHGRTRSRSTTALWPRTC